MNNQFLASTAMSLQQPAQYALMAPSFSASTRQIPQAMLAQQEASVLPAPNAMNSHQITAEAMQNRPLWRNGEKTFPYKVYDMLEFAETSGNTNICSWLPGGESFVIHDRKLFTEFILPRFFLHKKWRSFTRQLNIWCFKRDFSVTVSDAYCHPFFKRGDVSKLACVERAESKNLFKKDPITNKRRPPKPGDNTFMAKLALGKNAIMKKTVGVPVPTKTTTVTTTGEPSPKKRRVTNSSTSEEEDVMDVASFLAGLKSKPKQPQEVTTASTAAEGNEDKPTQGGLPKNTSEEDVSKVEAIFASRMNNMLANHRHLVPVPNNTIPAMPSSPSLPQTVSVPRMNTMNGNNNAVNMSNQSLHNMNEPNTSFDRESLRRLSTDQLVALASQMKMREQMLRERTLSLQATMAPSIAQMAPSNNSEFYHEMLLQSRAMRGSLPSQRLLSQGMAQSLMGVNKPKSSYEELAALNGLQHSTTTGIPNISQNLGYPRAA